MDLSEFLLARIAEDARLARGTGGGAWRYSNEETIDGENVYWTVMGPDDFYICLPIDPGDADRATHIARWDPARVLAECEAKRRIVEAYLDERTRRDIYQRDDARAVEDDEQAQRRRGAAARCRGLEIAVEQLALPYAGHCDYQQEWAVEK